MADEYEDELPVTRAIIQKYKTKLEKCLREYNGLNENLAAYESY